MVLRNFVTEEFITLDYAKKYTEKFVKAWSEPEIPLDIQFYINNDLRTVLRTATNDRIDKMLEIDGIIDFIMAGLSIDGCLLQRYNHIEFAVELLDRIIAILNR